MQLEPCDIFFTRSRSAIGRAIRFLSRGDESHMGMIATGGYVTKAKAIEALFDGVKEHPFYDYYSQRDTLVEVYRPLNLTDQQKAGIIASARKEVGRPYGYFDLGMHFFDATISGGINLIMTPFRAIFHRIPQADLYAFRRLGKIGPWGVCSWLILKSFKDWGLDFGLEPNEGQPDDAKRFMVSEPNKYRLIKEFSYVRDWDAC